MKHDLAIKEGNIQQLQQETQEEADIRNKTDIKLNTHIRDLKSSISSLMQELNEAKKNTDYHELQFNLESEINKRHIADEALLEEISQTKKWLVNHISEELDLINQEITVKNNDCLSVQLQQQMMEESKIRNQSDSAILQQLEEVHKDLSSQFTTQVERVEQTFAKQLHAKISKEEEMRNLVNHELSGQIESVNRVTDDSITEFHERIDKMDETLRNLLKTMNTTE
jgi:hypothetical protein